MEPNQLSKAEKVAAKKAGKLARRAHLKAVADALDAGLEPPAMMNKDAAVSVAHRSLPLPPRNLAANATTICLCYQYKEPAWTKKQHKHAITKITDLAKLHNITGRGRCAPEGLNCTLTASASNMRMFCYALRDWNLLFHETDFKLSDGEPASALFRTFTLRKVTELVGYGLGGVKAPSLSRHAGKHLEAVQYHEQMKKKDTVIIDVRNAYESQIGSFKPPEGGAQLIDPKLRNSIEFPKWLNDPSTQEQLNGKKVLMYCTGGIRCERASALLNQMSTVNPNLKPQGVYELRGGIERYVKTFPEGGYWSGKNYLFDRRMEQTPGTANPDVIEEQIDSKCCLCRKKWTYYRGLYKCSKSLCGVPVVVCTGCTDKATNQPHILTCELCREGYKVPDTKPDLAALKRKAEAIVASTDTSSRTNTNNEKKRKIDDNVNQAVCPHRLFLSRLPLTVTAAKLRTAVISTEVSTTATHVTKRSRKNSFDSDSDSGSGSDADAPDEQLACTGIKELYWLTDKSTGAFYGSAIVNMHTVNCAQSAYAQATSPHGVKIDGKKIRINFAKTSNTKDNNSNEDAFPPAGAAQGEFPPVGK